jgi:hypothetical protein
MSDQRKLEVVAELTDDALTMAFFEAIKRENGGGGDAANSGLDAEIRNILGLPSVDFACRG